MDHYPACPLGISTKHTYTPSWLDAATTSSSHILNNSQLDHNRGRNLLINKTLCKLCYLFCQ